MIFLVLFHLQLYACWDHTFLSHIVFARIFFFLSGFCWLLKRHGDYALFQYSSTVYGMAKNNLFLDCVVKLILANNLGEVFFSFVGKYFIFDSFDFNIYDYSSFSILSWNSFGKLFSLFPSSSFLSTWCLKNKQMNKNGISWFLLSLSNPIKFFLKIIF